MVRTKPITQFRRREEKYLAKENKIIKSTNYYDKAWTAKK